MRHAVEGYALVWLVLGSMTQTSGCQEHAGVSPSTQTLEQVSVTARKHPDATGNREEGVQSGNVQEDPPFEVAWRSIEGLKIRYAMNGGGGETVVLFSPWPESIFAFTPIWTALTKRFQVIAIDLPGFGRSEARDDLFAPQRMGAFITRAIEAFGKTSVHAVGLDVGSPSVLFAALGRPDLFRSLVVGAGAATYPLVVEGNLKRMIEAEPPLALRAADVVGRVLAAIRGYSVPSFVRDDYLASYEGARMSRSAQLIRAYPNDLAVLAPRLTSVTIPVAIVVGRNDPYNLARDAALLRERLPHARLDVLESGHCVWEERAPEFESIVAEWVSGGFERSDAQ
jgi:pimeloyl-ACP methyl ester carboxylesterase